MRYTLHGQKESIESVLLLYDSHVEKKSKFRHLRKLIKHTNLNLSESRIPIINDLLSEKARLYASRWRLFGGWVYPYT